MEEQIRKLIQEEIAKAFGLVKAEAESYSNYDTGELEISARSAISTVFQQVAREMFRGSSDVEHHYACDTNYGQPCDMQCK